MNRRVSGKTATTSVLAALVFGLPFLFVAWTRAFLIGIIAAASFVGYAMITDRISAGRKGRKG
jgi:hypothetical protein